MKNMLKPERVVDALLFAYNEIRAHHPDVRPALFNIYYTQERDRIDVFATSSADLIHISASTFAKGAAFVLQFLLHQAAHSINFVREVRDVSRDGRYHNKHFRKAAEELGLILEYDPRIGFVVTGLTDQAAQCYRHVLNEIKACYAIYVSLLGDYRTAAPVELGQNRQIKAVCSCGRIIRGAKSTLMAAPIWCAQCGNQFEPVE